jgi:DnaJ-class molecular chaperone
VKNTYYETLGVAEAATADEIKSAYKAKVVEYHPDHNGGDAVAAERLKVINVVYEILSDEQKRAGYNEELRVARARAETAKRAAAVASQPEFEPRAPLPAPAARPVVQFSRSPTSFADVLMGAGILVAVAFGARAIAGSGSYYDRNADRRRSKRTGRFVSG